MDNKVSMAQNYKADINWIFQAYSNAGVTLVDGFQKDAIQNCVGARETNSWKNWKCNISIVKNTKGTFLVIEDEGTVGLIGPNINAKEIQEMINNDEPINPAWRLARFSARNVSGGNNTGPGKYGVGKSVYSAASNDYVYYFDSYTKEGKYVANVNDVGDIYATAFEGDSATKFIKKHTGLSRKNSVGTRVIIQNPKQELIENIEDGTIDKYIQESWWLSIQKMGENSGIFVNGKRINTPSLPIMKYSYELKNPEQYLPGYRVKHFKFGIYDTKARPEETGVAYYRMGMRIGSVDLDDIPSAVRDKYWGFIEVDSEWEEELSQIEDSIHYGVLPRKKHTTTYRNLKSYINQNVHTLLVQWGLVKDQETESKKVNDALQEITNELNELFDDLGYDNLGKGNKKKDFDVRLKGVEYPEDNGSEVGTGDTINFAFRITNNYSAKKEFSYKVEVISKDSKQLFHFISEKKVAIEPGNCFDSDVMNFVVNSSSATKYEQNTIVITVKVKGSNKEKRKEIPFYFDCLRPDNAKQNVEITLHSITYPNDKSRRVDFGQYLKNVSYLISNQKDFAFDFRLSVTLHNCEDPNNPKIKDIYAANYNIASHEEKIVNDIPDIYFDSNEIGKYLEKGVVELRARVVSLTENEVFEKGQKITFYNAKVYLNQNEKNGKEGSFLPSTVNEPENNRRSWKINNGPNDRRIYINMGHPAYKTVQDDEPRWKSYLKEELLKQYVLLYVDEGNSSIFGGKQALDTLDPITAISIVMDKIEEVYRSSFD